MICFGFNAKCDGNCHKRRFHTPSYLNTDERSQNDAEAEFQENPHSRCGNKKVEGIISATDFVNIFGGGPKFGLIKGRYGGNLSAAVNEVVETIMERKVVKVYEEDSLEEAVETMFEKMWVAAR